MIRNYGDDPTDEMIRNAPVHHHLRGVCVSFGLNHGRILRAYRVYRSKLRKIERNDWVFDGVCFYGAVKDEYSKSLADEAIGHYSERLTEV
jgi:hypothetical protein